MLLKLSETKSQKSVEMLGIGNEIGFIEANCSLTADKPPRIDSKLILGNVGISNELVCLGILKTIIQRRNLRSLNTFVLIFQKMTKSQKYQRHIGH